METGRRLVVFASGFAALLGRNTVVGLIRYQGCDHGFSQAIELSPEAMKFRFYMLAPPYWHGSAGNVVMHELVSDVQALGYEARWVSFIPSADGQSDAYDWDAAHGIGDADAVAIYPEIVIGNPLRARHVVRYVLNLPGALREGRTMQEDANDFLLAYSPRFCSNAHGMLTKLVLLPEPAHWDADEFEDRSINATYVGKGRDLNECFLMPDSIEITRLDPPTREDLYDLLRQVKFFFSWDSVSAINFEAAMLGAVPILMSEAQIPFQKAIEEGEWGQMPFGFLKRVGGELEVHYPDDFQERRSRMIQAVQRVRDAYPEQLQNAIKKIHEHFSLGLHEVNTA